MSFCSLFRRCAYLCVLALAVPGCDGGPSGSDFGSCDGVVSGPSGGPATDAITVCVIDEAGSPIAGAQVSTGGISVGVSDDSGRVEVDFSPNGAIEVTSPGLVPHTVLGAATRRFGVVLGRGSAPTRTVTGTLSGINLLPLPPAGYRRVVEIRGASLFNPLSLTDGLAIGAPAECTLAGDTCTFSLELDERVAHINATVIDTTSAFADRLVAAFAISGEIGTDAVDFEISASDGGVSDVSIGAGADVVVGVPGSRIGNDVLLFGSPSATDSVPVPDATFAGSPWLAVIYSGPSDELHAGVVTRPGSSTSAPPAPGVSISAGTLTLPAERVSTISLGDGTRETWRATVVDGRCSVNLPDAGATRVAVLVHGSSVGAGIETLDSIQAVVTLPLVR